MASKRYAQVLSETVRKSYSQRDQVCVTLFGLDQGDIAVLKRALSAPFIEDLGDKVLVFKTDHMEVLNILSSKQGYEIAYEPKVMSIPTPSSSTFNKTLNIYTIVKKIQG